MDRERRFFLKKGVAAAAGLMISSNPSRVFASLAEKRELSFFNTHTNEKLNVCYFQGGTYNPSALKAIYYILRDHRSGDIKAIDSHLLDLVWRLRQELGTSSPLHIISGYRSPATNAMLRSHSRGVAKKSLHMKGMAMDIRIPGVPLDELHEAAVSLKGGGVGLYRASNFVHIDTGRVRYW